MTGINPFTFGFTGIFTGVIPGYVESVSEDPGGLLICNDQTFHG